MYSCWPAAVACVSKKRLAPPPPPRLPARSPPDLPPCTQLPSGPLYSGIGEVYGVPKVHYKGQQGEFYVVIMDLLGPRCAQDICCGGSPLCAQLLEPLCLAGGEPWLHRAEANHDAWL